MAALNKNVLLNMSIVLGGGRKNLYIYCLLLKLVFLFAVISYAVIWILLSNGYSYNGRMFRNKCNYGPNGPKIYCAVVTHFANLATKVVAVNQTWGRRCDKLLFATGQKPNQTNNTEIPENLNIVFLNSSDDYFKLTSKTLEMLKYVYETTKPGDFDWLLKADDDTYVIMENLKWFLNDRCPNETQTYGFNLDVKGTRYHSGGGGYTISWGIMKKLGTALVRDSRLCDTSHQIEDIEIAMCLRKRFRVTIGESRDRHGRERFHATHLKLHWDKPHAANAWLQRYAMHRVKFGPDCCSPTSISYHYVNEQEMHQYEFLLYRLKKVELNFITNSNDYD